MSNNITWSGDLLNRKVESDYLITYLVNHYINNPDSPFVLNINAEWGFGKTYFLENLAKDLENKKHPVVYFDAWKNDFTDNPLLAFISDLNTSLDSYFSNDSRAKSLLKSAYTTSKSIFLPILTKKLTGHAISELSDLVEDGNTAETKHDESSIDAEIQEGISSVISKVAEIALSEHKTIQNSIETFKIQMKKLLTHIDKKMDAKNLPMFILIDELDRCRPSYAIELLENIKHIFDIPGVVFIVATDSQQLAHSINAIYGNNFSSERYLKRFFHQEYNLAKPDNYRYAHYLLDTHNLLNKRKIFSPLDKPTYSDQVHSNHDSGIDAIDNIDTKLIVTLFAKFSTFFKLPLRDQEQVATMLETIVLVIPDDEVIHLTYLLFLIMLKQKNNAAFVKFNETNPESRQVLVTRDFLEIVGVDMTVTIKDRDLNFNTIDHSMYSIVMLYLKLLDITYGKFTNTYDRNINNMIDQNIASKIRSEMKSNLDTKVKVTTNLNKYPELVLRAGQFTIYQE